MDGAIQRLRSMAASFHVWTALINESKSLFMCSSTLFYSQLYNNTLQTQFHAYVHDFEVHGELTRGTENEGVVVQYGRYS